MAEDWRDELFAYIGGTVEAHEATLLASGGIDDHIHLLLRIHPSFAISDTLRHLKANSSRWINEGGKVDCKFEWQRGYGAFSVSQSNSDEVKRYIRNQKNTMSNARFGMSTCSS